MADNRFGKPPANGTQVTLTPSGSTITPHRVTVRRDGELVKETDYTSLGDAQRALAEEQKAALNALRA